MDPNVFETANAGFAQAIYEDFLRDPDSVSPEWRRLFESGVVGERPDYGANGFHTGLGPAPADVNGRRNGAATGSAAPAA
ncbi:MAG TPA: hypothetical protein VNK43_02520, partial [Gemmatimonadales bacterium]|nr:hypothetical protein [Gemmatimonadales bacterium]